MLIRSELISDIDSIYRLNVEAFGQNAEAEVINELRKDGALSYSIVALMEKELIGHLAFSPVTIEKGKEINFAIGLGPMAVKPAYQKTGVGTRMFNYWMNNFDVAEHELAIVLGYPEYYKRFGFVTSSKFGIKWEKEVPEEYFMVKELREGALNKISGVVKYHPAFNVV